MIFPATGLAPSCLRWPAAARGSGSRGTAAAVAAARTRSGSPYSGCSRSHSETLRNPAAVAALPAVGPGAGWPA